MVRYLIIYSLFCLIIGNAASAQRTDLGRKIANAKLRTNLKAVGHGMLWNEYPRPGMVRKHWINLNGLWKYQVLDSSTVNLNRPDGEILVPFPIESQLSRVQRPLFPHETLVYSREVQLSRLRNGDRYLLHFGAVDWEAEVFVNGRFVGKHAGGYESFTFDVTEYLSANGPELIKVAVKDPTDRGINPHGKQTLRPGNIYYTPTSGIWQTVWIERVPARYIESARITPDIDRGTVQVVPMVSHSQGEQVRVSILDNDRVIAAGTEKTGKPICIKLPNPKLWSPESPFLYDLKIELLEDGRVADQVGSYVGMRKVSIGRGADGHPRIQINNKTVFNLGVLDQGFWPDGLYTAPSAAALKFDIATIKAMGFNTIRKHIKVEPQLWYYYADKLGMLVWQDFVNPPQGLPDGAQGEFERELKTTIAQLQNHPSIVSWVVFNESWGAFDQGRMTQMVKGADSTRLVNGHSGQLLYVNNRLKKKVEVPWIGSDIADIHAYPFPRAIENANGKVQAIGEFGGITVSVPYHSWNDLQTWGYDTKSANQFRTIYRQMIDSVAKLQTAGLSAAIYTQPFDVETEENGFISYDRSVLKIPFDTMRSINAVLVTPCIQSRVGNISAAYKLINEQDTDERYADYLNEIYKGKRDSAVIRRMILLAMKKEDSANLCKLSGIYLDVVKNCLAYDNAVLMANVVTTPQNPGYSFLFNDSAAVQRSIGQITFNMWRKIVIRKQYINQMLAAKRPLDWDSVGHIVGRIYGAPGKEYVWGHAMVQRWREENWGEFMRFYKMYYETAVATSDYNTNSLSWEVFLHSNDPATLQFARDVSKFNMEYKDSSPNAIDTYANILYKLGEKEKALVFQRKAAAAAPDDPEITAALDKMQRGIPTWPTNSTQQQ